MQLLGQRLIAIFRLHMHKAWLHKTGVTSRTWTPPPPYHPQSLPGPHQDGLLLPGEDIWLPPPPTPAPCLLPLPVSILSSVLTPLPGPPWLLDPQPSPLPLVLPTPLNYYQTQPDSWIFFPFQDTVWFHNNQTVSPWGQGPSSFPSQLWREQCDAKTWVPILCIYWAKCLTRASCRLGTMTAGTFGTGSLVRGREGNVNNQV